MENKFYVYGHYTKDTNELFYVGKGVGVRAWSRDKRSRWWTRTVNKHGLEIKLLFENLTESEAHDKEMKLIQQHGRRNNNTGILINLTEGGEGISGYKHTESTKRIISNKLSGRTLSEPHKTAISKSNAGKVVSEEERVNMSKRMKLVWKREEHRKNILEKNKSAWTDERKQKQSERRKGIPLSTNTRNKISIKLTGKQLSEETKEKIRKKNSGNTHPMYGKPRSEETKRKMSETMKKKHLDKQNNT